MCKRVQEPDPAMIRAAAAGDLRAFESLVREHQATVVRFVRHLVGDDATAEDIAQETFIRVHRRIGTFKFRSRFTTWLLQIARNAAVDELRGRARRERLALVAPPSAPPSSPDARAELRAALASLSPTIVEALVLVEVFGCRYEDVGEVLGVPTGTVKSRVFQARRKLHEWRAAADAEAGGVCRDADLRHRPAVAVGPGRRRAARRRPRRGRDPRRRRAPTARRSTTRSARCASSCASNPSARCPTSPRRSRPRASTAAGATAWVAAVAAAVVGVVAGATFVGPATSPTRWRPPTSPTRVVEVQPAVSSLTADARVDRGRPHVDGHARLPRRRSRSPSC